MFKRLGLAYFAIGIILALPTRAGADLPSPMSGVLFGFPASPPSPASAASAGVGLADLWLGDDPTGNPAARVPRGILLSPALLRVSRQDIRADNRNVDEQGAFFDLAGGWAAFPVGRLAINLYAFHPILRLEENAFQRGDIGGPTPPAVVQSRSTMRELRAGLAASWGLGPLRVGAAGEWTRRSDEYFTREASGSPDAGDRRVEFTGDGVGYQVGLRWDADGWQPGALALGLGARYVPAITVEGEQRLTLLVGDSLGQVSAEREAGWEGGVSARAAIGEAFAVVAGVGARTGQDWQGFGVRSGAGSTWSLGIQFHDARDSWTLRFGLGQGQQEDVAESRTGIIGLGVGWSFGSTVLDLGAMRRTIGRTDHPTSYDDRLVGSVHIAL